MLAQLASAEPWTAVCLFRPPYSVTPRLSDLRSGARNASRVAIALMISVIGFYTDGLSALLTIITRSLRTEISTSIDTAADGDFSERFLHLALIYFSFPQALFVLHISYGRPSAGSSCWRRCRTRHRVPSSILHPWRTDAKCSQSFGIWSSFAFSRSCWARQPLSVQFPQSPTLCFCPVVGIRPGSLYEYACLSNVFSPPP